MAKGLVIAAPSSGSGKTVVTLGLLAPCAIAASRSPPPRPGPTISIRASTKPRPGAPASISIPGRWAGTPRRYLVSSRRMRTSCSSKASWACSMAATGGGGSTADLAASSAAGRSRRRLPRAMGQSIAALVGASPASARRAWPASSSIASPASGMSACIDRGARGAGPAAPRRHPARYAGLRCRRAISVSSRPPRSRRSAPSSITRPAAIVAIASTSTPCCACAGRYQHRQAPGCRHRAAARPAHRGRPRRCAFAFAYPHLLDDWRGHGAEIVAILARSPTRRLPGRRCGVFARRLSGAARRARSPETPVSCDGLRARRAALRADLWRVRRLMVLGRRLTDGDGTPPWHGGPAAASRPSFAGRQLHLGYRRLGHRSPLPWPRKPAAATSSTMPAWPAAAPTALRGNRRQGRKSRRPMGTRNAPKVMGSLCPYHRMASDKRWHAR